MDVNFGNIKCSSHSIQQQLDEILALLKDRSLQPRLILTMNAHIFNMAYSDEKLRSIMNSARMVTADGMAIVWASRLFDEKIESRCNATEAFRAFLAEESMPENRGLLIGCTNVEVEKARKNIHNASGHCAIIEAVDGFRDNESYARLLGKHQDIDFIFLGMGTPKTEIIGYLASSLCPNAIVWGIGGGTIKIYSDTTKEAPSIFRRTGFQWLYRLMLDPKRLWRRYLIGNPLFLLRVMKLYMNRKFSRK